LHLTTGFKFSFHLQKKTKIILGVDPGTIIMGYGLIRCTGNEVTLLDMDVLKPGAHKDIYKRLHLIHETISGLIVKYRPTDFAIEAPFFGKNVQSMLKLGRAQGVAIAAAMQAGLSVTEYSPKKVKQSVTGNGNAGKEQVWMMLQRILQIRDEPRYFDATDAVGVALCHHFNSKLPEATSTVKKPAAKKTSSWESFVTQNPGRVKKK
jgi:crossover junction endodeoxyribonuclease RuvC